LGTKPQDAPATRLTWARRASTDPYESFNGQLIGQQRERGVVRLIRDVEGGEEQGLAGRKRLLGGKRLSDRRAKPFKVGVIAAAGRDQRQARPQRGFG
jgi:hypothetical protein